MNGLLALAEVSGTDNSRANAVGVSKLTNVGQIEPEQVDEAALIQKFGRMGPKKASADPRAGGMALHEIKVIASHLHIPNSGKKKEWLCDVIANHLKREQQLDAMERNFKRCKNTFPRICNILMGKYKDELVLSQAAASRMELEFRVTGAQHPLWLQVAEDFKSPDVRFGCVAPLDPILIKEGINPDAIDFRAAANISAKDIFEIAD